MSSVGTCAVNTFNTLRLRDRSADVDETWLAYFMGLGTKLLGSRFLNFGPCAARGHPELSPVGRDNPLRERGAYCPVRQIQSVKIVSACDFVRQYPAVHCRVMHFNATF